MAEVSPLDYAIQLERDGQTYYSDAASNTSNPLGQKMFESLAADERRHEAILRQVAREMDIELPEDTPKQRIVTLFDELGPAMRQELGAEPGDTDVVRKAIDMEKRSVELYADQREKAEAEADRALYARLVLEEQQHMDILQNTLTYLEDSGHWFLWDEQAILD
ncbi:MAG: ferritin family protein [Planctomycetota bacterium]